jgi:hypothetical protein
MIQFFLVAWCAITTIYFAIKAIAKIHDSYQRRQQERSAKAIREREQHENAEAARESQLRSDTERQRLREEGRREEAERVREYRDANRVFYATQTFSKSLEIKISGSQIADCPLCREDVSKEDFLCSSCQTIVHRECLDEMSDGECPTLGCAKSYKILA